MATSQGDVRRGRRARRVQGGQGTVPAGVAPTDVEALNALLDEWMADESGYDEATWPKLEAALEQDRLSSRKLFHG
jgi:hypothetical protein